MYLHMLDSPPPEWAAATLPPRDDALSPTMQRLLLDVVTNHWEWTYAVLKMIKLMILLNAFAHWQACLGLTVALPCQGPSNQSVGKIWLPHTNVARLHSRNS